MKQPTTLKNIQIKADDIRSRKMRNAIFLLIIYWWVETICLKRPIIFLYGKYFSYSFKNITSESSFCPEYNVSLPRFRGNFIRVIAISMSLRKTLIEESRSGPNPMKIRRFSPNSLLLLKFIKGIDPLKLFVWVSFFLCYNQVQRDGITRNRAIGGGYKSIKKLCKQTLGIASLCTREIRFLNTFVIQLLLL